jgi:hypothetical protein
MSKWPTNPLFIEYFIDNNYGKGGGRTWDLSNHPWESLSTCYSYDWLIKIFLLYHPHIKLDEPYM